MRKLIGTLVLLLLVLAAVGYFQGWFKFNVSDDGAGGKKIQVDLDAAAAKKKAQDLIK